MFELHIEISEQLPLERALFSASCAKLKAVGLVYSSLTITKEEVANIKKYARELALLYDIEAFIGFKLKHVPPALIPQYIEEMRSRGFNFVGVHGENVNDIVEQGTNLAAISGNADILYNAGRIDKKLIEYSKEKNIFFEFNVNPLYSSGNALLAEAACADNIKLFWGNTIQKDADFMNSLRRDEYAKLCPIFYENPLNFDLIKKLNQDTLELVQIIT